MKLLTGASINITSGKGDNTDAFGSFRFLLKIYLTENGMRRNLIQNQDYRANPILFLKYTIHLARQDT